jgi:hypothetical protein
MVMGHSGPEIRNGCAGEGQQQIIAAAAADAGQSPWGQRTVGVSTG